MSDIDLEIPAFLRRYKGEKRKPWKPMPVKAQEPEPEPKQDWRLPRNMDAAGWEIVREAEAARERKKQEGLAALKRWKLENKR